MDRGEKSSMTRYKGTLRREPIVTYHIHRTKINYIRVVIVSEAISRVVT